MQTGFYPRMFGPSLIFVRFRCARCKKFGEQFVKQEEWESGILKDSVVEASSTEQEHFSELGPIAMQELADFHAALENLSDLADLNREFQPSENRDSDDKAK
jgi:hypothetical protein